MKRVITYGTFDMFHTGHRNLLRNAKALGDYLIVGVTSENFDRNRGKLNVHDSLMVRIENVRKSGYADEIIVEEYMGQKIDDIRKYDIDIFTVGSDWVGHFDYLKEYCEVRYLPRTKGISSTDIRNRNLVRIGILGAENIVRRFVAEQRYVSGTELSGIWDGSFPGQAANLSSALGVPLFEDLDALMDASDAVYINTPPVTHEGYIRKAIKAGKHVLCEFPFVFSSVAVDELYAMARERGVVLFHGLKTAYCPAFRRLISHAKTGLIGNIITVDASFTQVLGNGVDHQIRISSGGSVHAFAEYPMLAFAKLLGQEIQQMEFFSRPNDAGYDIYTRLILRYPHAIGSATVGIDAKSEGCLVITGTRGYIYVPAPWWKTEYYEARFEDTNKNMKFFYKFQGEGLRYEIAEFIKCTHAGKESLLLTSEETRLMAQIMETFDRGDQTLVF